MKFIGHPSTHGHHVNPYLCGSGQHRYCDGFSGDYDTYMCGCCCHDAPGELSDSDRVIVGRLLAGAAVTT